MNEAGLRVLNWGPVKNEINFISAKPALVIEPPEKTKIPEDADMSEYSQKEEVE